MSKHEYFSRIELAVLAAKSNSFDELKNISVTLMYLWALGESIDTNYFNKCAHKRLNQIYSQ